MSVPALEARGNVSAQREAEEVCEDDDGRGTRRGADQQGYVLFQSLLG